MKAFLQFKLKLCLLSGIFLFNMLMVVESQAQTYCTPSASGWNNYIVGASTTGGIMNFTRTSTDEVYTNNSGTHQVSQVQGLNVTFTVNTCGTSGAWCSTSYCKIWVDWNQDGDFDDPGEEVYSSGYAPSFPGAYVFTGDITVPFTAVPGLTRMRIYTDWNEAPMYGYPVIAPCGSADWGEVEDYGFVVISSIACSDPSYTLDAGTLSNIEVCPSKPFSLTPTGAALAAGLNYMWQSRVGTGAWTTIAGATTLSYSSPTGITSETQYRLIITCPATGDADTTNVATVSIAPFFDCYCTPSATYPTNNYITKVKTTEGITNFECTSTTGSLTSSGYSDYTDIHSASAVQGTNFNIEVTNYEWGSYSHCKIWIDFNQNGSFDDPGELVYTAPAAGMLFSGTIAVPTTAIPGATRMRVRTNWEWGTPLTDCSSMDYGEAEDYTFIVIEAIPCTSTTVSFPDAAEAVASSEYVCGTGSSVLNITTAMPIASGITYQWQSATSAAGPWTNISGDLIDPMFNVPTISATTYFRCIIKCAGSAVLTSSNVIVESVIPVSPTLYEGQTCGPGPVQLTGTVGSGTIFWYDVPSGGVAFASGDTIMTPEISTTTTFYASGGAFPDVLAQIGTSTSTSSTSSVGPFNTYYRRSTMQLMYTKDQIEDAGGFAGLINDVRLNLKSLPGHPLPDYTMSIKTVPTTMTTLTWQTTGFTEFFGGTGYTYTPTATGWQIYPIPGGFNWDGNSNIVIKICWSAVPSWVSAGTHEYTTKSGQFLNYRDDSAGSACGMTGSSSSSELPNIIFNFEGCVTARYPVVAHVRDTPNITIPVIDGEYCVFNNQFSLPSTPEQPTVNTFLWSDGSTGSFMVAGPTYGVQETFWVEVTNEWGCTSSDSVKLILNPSPDVDLGNDTLVCNGGVVTVDAGVGGTSYYWNTGDVTQVITIDDAGQYYVLVGNDYGCIGTDTINIEVSDDFMPSLAAIMVDNIAPNTFKFTPYHPEYVLSYEWDFGDDSPIVYAESPIHTYAEPGTYLVTVKVYSSCGNTTHSTYATVYTSNADMEANSKNLKIFPNPANSILNLETIGDVYMHHVSLVNTLGQEILNTPIQNATAHQINVEQLPSGMYFIKIDTNKGVILKKFQVIK